MDTDFQKIIHIFTIFVVPDIIFYLVSLNFDMLYNLSAHTQCGRRAELVSGFEIFRSLSGRALLWTKTICTILVDG